METRIVNKIVFIDMLMWVSFGILSICESCEYAWVKYDDVIGSIFTRVFFSVFEHFRLFLDYRPLRDINLWTLMEIQMPRSSHFVW